MGYYTSKDLPAYDFLARNFCVCDAWHAVDPRRHLAEPAVLAGRARRARRSIRRLLDKLAGLIAAR